MKAEVTCPGRGLTLICQNMLLPDADVCQFHQDSLAGWGKSSERVFPSFELWPIPALFSCFLAVASLFVKQIFMENGKNCQLNKAKVCFFLFFLSLFLLITLFALFKYEDKEPEMLSGKTAKSNVKIFLTKSGFL